MVWLMIALFFTLIFLGVPIVFSMVISTTFGMLVFDVPLMMIIQKMHSGIDAFPYLAIPFFVLAGALMETGGISLRLVNLAKAMVGHSGRARYGRGGFRNAFLRHLRIVRRRCFRSWIGYDSGDEAQRIFQ
jgi:hypothetical protein